MFEYQYPRPAYTADVVVTLAGESGISVLLIRRANEPFKDCWALPGGFVDEGEMSTEAAVRELCEETGVYVPVEKLNFLGIFDTPGRDPRGWTISAAYVTHFNAPPAVFGADDAAEARWFDVSDLPKLAFDHAEIIEQAVGETTVFD